MTPHTAALILFCAVSVLVGLLVVTRANWMLAAYLLAAQLPYLIAFLSGHHFAVGLGAWWAAAWHLALAIHAAWGVLHQPRFAGLWPALLLALAAALAVSLPDPGTVQEYKLEYYVLTIAVTWAATLTGFVALMVGWFSRFPDFRAMWNCVIVFTWFAPEVFIASQYRLLSGAEYDRAWARLFVMDATAHLACAVTWGALYGYRAANSSRT